MNACGRKLFACILTIIMICGTLAFINPVSAEEPVDVTIEDDNPVPNLHVTKLRASEPVIYTGQTTRLALTIANNGSANAIKVVASVIDIKPDMSEELIKTLHFGALIVDMEKIRFVDWCPEELGTHYIKVNITCEYLNHSSPAEMVESPPTILSVGFPVSPLATEEYWGPSYPIKSTITALEGIRIVDEPKTIFVDGGDLKIETGAKLILNEQVTLVMLEPNRGIYDIIVEPGATFEINGGAIKTTKVQSPSSNPDFTYAFYNNGTVDFYGAQVLYTYGPSDTTQAGGIRNLPDSTCIIDNCNLLEADTHSLYIDGSADVHVRSADTIIGSDDENSAQANGHGIFVDSALPVIEDVTVKHNELDGIHIDDSTSKGPILASNLEDYSSTNFDYKMPTLPAHTKSMSPLVAVGDVAHAIWTGDEPNIFVPGKPTRYGAVHLMYSSSTDNGRTWSEPISLISNSKHPQALPNFSPDTVDIASDGEYVGIVWVKTIGYHTEYKLTYSDDNGENWKETVTFYPTETTSEGSICIDWQGDTAYIVFRKIPLEQVGQYVFQGIAFRTFSNGEPGEIEELFDTDGYGIPKIAVDGDDIHVVFCAPDSPDPNISDKAIYIHGSILSGVWDGYLTIATYDIDGVAFNREAFNLAAKDDTVYFVWHDYDSDNYNIYNVKGTAPFLETDWGSAVQLTSDTGNSLYPNCVLDSNLNLLVVWQDDRGGAVNIRYSQIDPGGTISPNDVALTQATADSINPCISIDEEDRIYFLWEDSRSGNSNIYWKWAKQLIVTGVTVNSNLRHGIDLYRSSGNTITHNIVSSNDMDGIRLITNCIDNTISYNNVNSNLYGIVLDDDNDYNTLTNNIIVSNNIDGLHLDHSRYNDITNNIIASNGLYGIFLRFSHFDLIRNNTISSNYNYGIYSLSSNSNLIYHNNILFNTNQAYDDGTNIWHNGYSDPFDPDTDGGNYWSDYTGDDLFSGPNQDIPGSDGIGDSPYSFDFAQDDYPLMGESTDITLDFEAGWNFISLPAIYPVLNGVYLASACDLAEATGADMVSAWNRNTQGWTNFISGFHLPGDSEDFQVLPDRAYFVWVDTPKTLTLQGLAPEKPRIVPLIGWYDDGKGWNDVGYMDPYNVGDVETDWAWQVSCGALDDIIYWDATIQDWVYYMYVGDVMDLVPGRGYFVWSDYAIDLVY